MQSALHSAPQDTTILAPMERALARPVIWAFALAALAGLQLALIWTHKPWGDEYQAALLAVEASSQAELFEWLRYEGHPPAWYWLLQALSLALPFALILPAAATLCAIIAQGVILFASPFSRSERLLLASSQYVAFEFLTISRGTSLGAALVLATLATWRSRWVWLIMAALPLVDFLFGVISGVFVILKWRERDVAWPGVGLWLAGSVFAGWSVIPAPNMVSAFDAVQTQPGPTPLIEPLMGWFMKMGSLVIPFQGGIAPQWNTQVAPIAGIAWIALLWLCWHLTKGFVWHRLMIFGFFGFTLVFSLAVYPIGLRHVMLGCLLLFASVWLQRQSERPSASETSAPWRIWLVALTLSGLATAALSTVRGFDSADRVIAEMESRDLVDKRWVALPEWRSPAIAGRSAIAFQRLGENCLFRFVRWDHALSALASGEAFTQALEADIAAHGRGYLVSDMEFNGFDPDLIAPIVSIPRGYNGVDYHLYVIGRKTTEKPRDLPFCHSVNNPDLAGSS